MKKINSEVKIDNNLFKIKIGTTDKKNPNVIYVEIGSYISPIEDIDAYTLHIEEIEKSTKNYLTDLLNKNESYEKDFIFISDVADERITKGKRSYIEMQIFVKPKLKLNCQKFSEISNKFNMECVNKILPVIENAIKTNGFECYKTRK